MARSGAARPLASASGARVVATAAPAAARPAASASSPTTRVASSLTTRVASSLAAGENVAGAFPSLSASRGRTSATGARVGATAAAPAAPAPPPAPSSAASSPVAAPSGAATTQPLSVQRPRRSTQAQTLENVRASLRCEQRSDEDASSAGVSTSTAGVRAAPSSSNSPECSSNSPECMRGSVTASRRESGALVLRVSDEASDDVVWTGDRAFVEETCQPRAGGGEDMWDCRSCGEKGWSVARAHVCISCGAASAKEAAAMEKAREAARQKEYVSPLERDPSCPGSG